MPELETLRAEFEPRGIGFVALSLNGDVAEVREAAQRLGIKMTIATGEGELLAPLGLTGVPSTVFIDKDGVIVAAATGEKSLASLRRRTQALLP